MKITFNNQRMARGSQKRLLITGPAYSGKTTLAKAIAEHYQKPLYQISTDFLGLETLLYPHDLIIIEDVVSQELMRDLERKVTGGFWVKNKTTLVVPDIIFITQNTALDAYRGEKLLLKSGWWCNDEIIQKRVEEALNYMYKKAKDNE